MATAYVLAQRFTTHPKFLPNPQRFITLRGGAEEEYCVVDVSKVGKPGGAARILEQMEVSRARSKMESYILAMTLPGWPLLDQSLQSTGVSFTTTLAITQAGSTSSRR